MALPSSGPISASQIRTEINVPSQSPFSLNSAEVLGYTDLNVLSISSSQGKPNIDTPNSMSEWYSYNHSLNRNCSSTSHVGLKSPYNYSYNTFAQIDIGTTSGTLSYTGSNFAISGSAPSASVSYSLYQSTYPSVSSGKLLKLGVLTSANPRDSVTYTYNVSSGSIVTFIFNSAGSTGGITCNSDCHVIFKNDAGSSRSFTFNAAGDECRGSFSFSTTLTAGEESDFYPRFLRAGNDFFPFSWTSTQNYSVTVEGSTDGVAYSTFTTFTVNNNTVTDTTSIDVPTSNGYHVRFRITS